MYFDCSVGDFYHCQFPLVIYFAFVQVEHGTSFQEQIACLSVCLHTF